MSASDFFTFYSFRRSYDRDLSTENTEIAELSDNIGDAAHDDEVALDHLFDDRPEMPVLAFETPLIF
jgi:hypothetical protein